MFADGSLLDGTVSCVESVRGVAALSGDFTVAFLGAETHALPFDVSGPAMRIALEDLATVGRVEVSRSAVGAGWEWSVTFLTEMGDLPSLVTTSGRLHSVSYDHAAGTQDNNDGKATVVETQAGTPSILVYDGKGSPSLKHHSASGLTTSLTRSTFSRDKMKLGDHCWEY